MINSQPIRLRLRLSPCLLAAAIFCILGSSEARAQCAPEEVAKLLADDGAPGDRFGRRVAISGDIAIVGAPGEDNENGVGAGSTYVFREDGGGNWVQIYKLIAADGAAGDAFGFSVAISSDTVIVAAVNDDDSAGSAYLFGDDGSGNWIQVDKITATDVATGDSFGFSVAISGDTAIVGAVNDDDNGSAAGSAYLFRDDGTGNWIQVDKITAADGVAGDWFAYSVGLSGDTAIIGAPGDSDFGYHSGSAYFFRHDGSGNWVQVDKFTETNIGDHQNCGVSVAMSGDTALIGASGNHESGIHTGAAYVLRTDGAGNWIEIDMITASDPTPYDAFGWYVAISGDNAIVSAVADDDNGNVSGSAYFFRDDGTGNWFQIEKVIASDGAAGDEFGYSVAISDDAAIAGAYLDDDSGTDSGSAYIFDLNCDTGVPATLTDFSVAFGSLVSGGLPDLVESDDARLHTRSIPGFTAEEANLMELRIGAATAVQSPTALDLTLEGRLNQPGGTVRVRFRHWSSNAFIQVHQYPIGFTEAVETIEGIDATNRVRASDGRIELSLRHSVFATFSALGFDSLTDQVAVVVR